MYVTTTNSLMTQSRKQELKDVVLWVIGCHAQVRGPEGLVKIKETDFQASLKEVRKHLGSRYLIYRDKPGVSRRSLHRYIQELIEEGFIKRVGRGVYRITDFGMKRWSLIDRLNQSFFLPPIKEPVGTFFSLVPDENGQAKYIDIIIRVADENLIKIIEKAVMKNKVAENHNRLGWLISLIIAMYFEDVFSAIRRLLKGKEEPFLELAESLPIYKKWLEAPERKR